jgi:serine/threonine protein kinase
MAEVFRARLIGPQGFERTLVIKRILPHLADDTGFNKMFASEARLSARLSHSNIVQVFDFGDVDGVLFLAMEYVEGCDLLSTLRRQSHLGKPMPIGEALYIAHEVLIALDYAHKLKGADGKPLRIVHRDVSPSNVMLARDGEVKLVDFGIAKMLASSTDPSTTKVLKGKLSYMAPEQLEDHPSLDHRVDQFAVGVVLHEMLTGRRLFRGMTDVQTMALVSKAMARAPSQLNREVNGELDRICLKALARDRDERFADCGDMAAAIDDVLHELRWRRPQAAAYLKELAANTLPGSDQETDGPLTRNYFDDGPNAGGYGVARSRRTFGRVVVGAALALSAGVVGGAYYQNRRVAAPTVQAPAPSLAASAPAAVSPPPPAPAQPAPSSAAPSSAAPSSAAPPIAASSTAPSLAAPPPVAPSQVAKKSATPARTRARPKRLATSRTPSDTSESKRDQPNVKRGDVFDPFK